MNANRQLNLTASPKKTSDIEKKKVSAVGFYQLSSAIPFISFRGKWQKIMVLMRNLRIHFDRKAVLGLFFAFICGRAEAAINVYFLNSTPPSLQADLLASLTTQYQATVTPGFFTNTYTVTVSSKQAVASCGGTSPCQLDLDISSMISVSTISYVYGWAAGQQYERNTDLGTIGNYVTNCSSATDFNHVSGSSATWDLGTCEDSLGTVSNFIYQQNFSSPTVLTGF